jgi:hypothetical protein
MAELKKKKKKKKVINGVEDVSGDIEPGVLESGQVSEGEFAAARPEANQGDATPEEGGIFDDLDQNTKSALSFFLPQAIAGLGAGLVGGSEAGLAAANEAERLTIGFQDHKLKEAKLRQTQTGSPTKFQQTRLVTDSGRTVMVDPTTNALFESGTNRQIRGEEKLVDPVTDRQDNRLVRTDRRLDFSEEKEGQLSGKQTDQLSAFDNTIASIGVITELKDRVNTGPFAGRAQNIGAAFGHADTDFITLRTEASAVLSSFQKALSGLTASDKETQRIMKIVPNENDDDEVFAAKLQTFQAITIRHKDAFLNAMRTGQKLKKETINAIMKEVEAVTGGPVKKKKGEIEKPVGITKPKGMSDAQFKKLLELRKKKRGN